MGALLMQLLVAAAVNAWQLLGPLWQRSCHALEAATMEGLLLQATSCPSSIGVGSFPKEGGSFRESKDEQGHARVGWCAGMGCL